MSQTIAWADFERVDIRVGTVVDARPFPEARKPAIRLWVDFGAGIGVRKSSAQITVHYSPDRLIGRGMATMNTSVMLGVACMQSLSGVIVGAFTPLPDGARSEDAYRTLFGFMVVVLLLAWVATQAGLGLAANFGGPFLRDPMYADKLTRIIGGATLKSALGTSG